MKKELAAIILLAALFAASLCNIHLIDTLTFDIEEELAFSKACADNGDYEGAMDHHRSALERWLSAESYTHIFLRHAEIDATSDAFYELLEKLKEPEERGINAAYGKLKYHLESLRGMEHISLGSIF